MPILATPKNMRAAAAPSALSKEGTHVLVRCSQSNGGGSCVRSNLCKFDDNHIVHRTSGFPIVVNMAVRLCSSCLTCNDCIYDHRSMQNFWIPFDSISSDDDAWNIISKLICLMNVPFSLETNTQRLSYIDDSTTAILTNKDSLISKIMKFARRMKDCPSNEDRWYLDLGITKVTYLPHDEFMKIYSKLGKDYNWKTWERTQEMLEARIAAFDKLKKIGIKKMTFRVDEFKDCNLLDTCSICHEEFLEGSMVSGINQCCHVYHDTCILEWLLRNPSCPYCRSKLA